MNNPRSPQQEHTSPSVPGLSVSAHRSPRRFLARMAAVVLALVFASTPAAADQPGSAQDALAWVDAALDANSGFLPAPGSDKPDWGLTADVALAHISAGDPTSDRTRAIAGALLDSLSSYSTWDDIGPEYPGVRLVGPLAKVLLASRSAGIDTTDVDGVDLAEELATLIRTSGPQAGRYSDRNDYGPDVSNGFGQAYAMLASALGGEVDPLSVQFLLAQQCPSGGFRLLYGDEPGCGTDDDADPDATALAIQVLLVLERTEAVGSALAKATGQLISIQGVDGSFAGAPPADVANANTTGLAAQALRAAGQSEPAEQASAWVAVQLQLGASATGTPAEGDIGAIAYEPAKRAAALSDGLGTGRDQWHRATPQGLLAFDAGLIVAEIDEPPVEPVIPSTTSTTTTTSSTTTSSSTTTTVAAGSSPPTPDNTPGDTRPVASVAGSQSTGAQLAATGSSGGILTTTGVALVATGMAAIWLAVRTRPRRESWHWRP